MPRMRNPKYGVSNLLDQGRFDVLVIPHGVSLNTESDEESKAPDSSTRVSRDGGRGRLSQEARSTMFIYRLPRTFEQVSLNQPSFWD